VLPELKQTGPKLMKKKQKKTSWRRSVTKEVGRSWNELRFLAADRNGKNS
jgi:hypothetical protein